MCGELRDICKSIVSVAKGVTDPTTRVGVPANVIVMIDRLIADREREIRELREMLHNAKSEMLHMQSEKDAMEARLDDIDEQARDI